MWSIDSWMPFSLLANGKTTRIMDDTAVRNLMVFINNPLDNGIQLGQSEEPRMMILSIGSKKRIHALNWAKRLARVESAVTIPKVHRRMVADWWKRSMSMRLMVWKCRSNWRQATRSRRGGVRFGYDPESYSQNFDDGFLHDHIAPSCSLA